MFDSLDYIYVPAADVDGEASRYVEVLGAEPAWKVRGKTLRFERNESRHGGFLLRRRPGE